MCEAGPQHSLARAGEAAAGFREPDQFHLQGWEAEACRHPSQVQDPDTSNFSHLAS